VKSTRLFRFSFFAVAVTLIALPLLLVSSVVANKRETGPRAAWLALNYRAAGKLDASWNDATGIPNFISGKDAATRLPYTVKPDERDKPERIARGFIAENAALFKIGADDAFALRRLEADKQLGFAHVRLDQTFKGIPVHAQQLVVHLDAQANIVAVNGQFVPNINVMTEPLLTKADAEKIARDDLLNGQLQANERARVTTMILDKTALEIYIDDANPQHATLTWHVVIMTHSPLGEWRYFVNARKPVVTHRFNNVASDKIRETYTANNSTDMPGRLLISEGERSTRDPIAQAAHDGAGKVYDYYFGTFKRDSVDGQGGKMVSSVHYGSDPEDAENAGWVGENQQMVYGDGGRIFKPLPYGLDVIGHEFTHGVIGSTAGLEYKGQSGALNESYADIFGALIDRGNWTIGEAVIKSPPLPRNVGTGLRALRGGRGVRAREKIVSAGEADDVLLTCVVHEIKPNCELTIIQPARKSVCLFFSHLTTTAVAKSHRAIEIAATHSEFDLRRIGRKRAEARFAAIQSIACCWRTLFATNLIRLSTDLATALPHDKRL